MQNASNVTDVISSMFWFKDDNEDMEKEPLVIEQFVQNVEDFSSQYGSEISVSYTAFNLRGPPSNFPDYGDYPQAFVMRTYGTWWEEAPSAQEDYMPQNSNNIASQDFVEVSFERAVFPIEVAVFETYNPGALVRIWAWGPFHSWTLLWEGEPEYVGDTPRIFSPPIREINFPTRVLRLEFNHKLLPYYTELDAVLLKGREPPNIVRLKNNFAYSSLFFTKTDPIPEKGHLLNRILASNLHESMAMAGNAMEPKHIDTGPPLGDFEQLPDETILCIMKYLDMQSLCRCAQVNRQFNRLASDSILYRSLDLRPYWHCVQSQVLVTLQMRCKFLQKLDLSWCGSHCMINSSYVVNFLKDSGADLTHLRMNCCKFVDNSVLKAVVDTSASLQELCLRSVTGCTNWDCLASLKRLRRLDLYRTDIAAPAAVSVIMANPKLEHLNVGSCKNISSMDEVALALGANCPNLVSVDFWKSYSLTSNGMRALGNCKNLQELDVGWCLQAGGSGEWLAWIAGGASHTPCELRKVFLGALRGVCDRDLFALLPRAPKLTQLDLLGVRAVTPDVCSAILAECRELRLLDVSFCDQIDESQVLEWRAQYPHVSIKRSFQSANLNTSPNALFLAPSLE